MTYGKGNKSGRSGFRRESSFRRRDGFGPREMHKIICNECKKDGEVPFKPRQGTPVFCKNCFAKRNGKTLRSESSGENSNE